MTKRWDAIVVGGRCAGASLATFLARRGLKVAVLEAAERGSGMAMSTHYMQPPGMDVLDTLGIGDRVRAASPATRRLRFRMDDAFIDTPMRDGRAGYCIQRSRLDPWLQDAAEQSGATLLDRHRVVELVRQGERVTGVVARTDSGTVTMHADLVVGADGMRSTMAQLTGAQEYLVQHGNRAGYWSYYPAPTTWEAEWDAILEHRGDGVRYVFRCDGDLLLVVYMGPQAEVSAWGRDHRQKFAAALEASETTAALCQGQSPVGKTTGLMRARYLYRKPVGPGWALVGDAGHMKDFVTGHGMTDALLDAQNLSEAILDGRPEAFEVYWRERDVATLPLHFDALRMGAVGFNGPFMRWVVDRASRRPDLGARLGLVFDRQVRPDQFVPTKTMLGFMGQALLHGRLDVLPGFLAAGRKLGQEAKELAAREALARVATEQLARAAPKARQTATSPLAPAPAE